MSRKFARTPLSICIAALLGASAGHAQNASPPPKLYTAVDESEIYVVQRDGSRTDVKTGESAVITEDGLEFISDRPNFLNWPCGTRYADNRGKMPIFSLDDLPAGDRIAEVADRFFSNQQVLAGKPDWLRGEYHGTFSASEIDQFVSNAFWYKFGETKEKMRALRPDTLLIGLFYGTGQVVVDTTFLDELKRIHGEDAIPVVFVYQDENVVPISYFGENASEAQVEKAYRESGIRPADLPMWYAGDHHATADPKALAEAMGVPPAGEMNVNRVAELEQDIRQNGFAYKPFTLALVPGGQDMILDEGERLRAAAEAGYASVPVQFTVYESDIIARHCGLPIPVTAAGVLGTKEGEAPGATPPEQPGPAPRGPLAPTRPSPPEIELPNPPQPDLPGAPAPRSGPPAPPPDDQLASDS